MCERETFPRQPLQPNNGVSVINGAAPDPDAAPAPPRRFANDPRRDPALCSPAAVKVTCTIIRSPSSEAGFEADEDQSSSAGR